MKLEVKWFGKHLCMSRLKSISGLLGLSGYHGVFCLNLLIFGILFLVTESFNQREEGIVSDPRISMD